MERTSKERNNIEKLRATISGSLNISGGFIIDVVDESTDTTISCGVEIDCGIKINLEAQGNLRALREKLNSEFSNKSEELEAQITNDLRKKIFDLERKLRSKEKKEFYENRSLRKEIDRLK